MSTVTNKRRDVERNTGADVTKIILSMVFIALVFIPLVRMFTFLKPESFKKVVTSPTFFEALSNSIVSSVLATVITATSC